MEVVRVVGAFVERTQQLGADKVRDLGVRHNHLVSLISEDGDVGKHAVDILRSLAINRPQTLPSTEINHLVDKDHMRSHLGSKYLTTLLAATGHGQAPHEPTISGFVEFGHLWHRAGSNGVLNQLLSSVITKRAVDDFFKSTIDEIGYKKMDLYTTPQGRCSDKDEE